MNTPDAILIHAAPVPNDVDLSPHALARLNRGAELYHQTGAAGVLLMADYTPRAHFGPDGMLPMGWSCGFHSRAAAWLEGAGVPRSKLCFSPLARDTAGEIYASRKAVMEPRGWTRLLGVSNEFHLTRCRLIASHFYGPGYEIHYEGVVTAWDHPPYIAGQLASERSSTAAFLDQFGPIRHGDDAAVERTFATRHALYRDLPPAQQIRFLEHVHA